MRAKYLAPTSIKHVPDHLFIRVVLLLLDVQVLSLINLLKGNVSMPYGYLSRRGNLINLAKVDVVIQSSLNSTI